MIQTNANFHITENLEETATQQMRFATGAIAFFYAQTSDDTYWSTSYDSIEFMGETNLLNIAARPTRERRGIQSDVVRMVNDTCILVFSRVGDIAIRVAL